MVSHSTSKKLSVASKKNHIRRGLKLEKTKEVLKSHKCDVEKCNFTAAFVKLGDNRKSKLEKE